MSAAILLATYNGATYLPAFLESLGSQTLRDGTVYWRDDGSNDGTVEILRSTKLPFRLHELPSSGRRGPCQSFLEILRAAAGRHSSYHFADQDDIWTPEKVERAHLAVSGCGQPALVHGRQQLIDSTGRGMGLSRLVPAGRVENAVVENIVVGCTAAFNNAAALLGAKGRPTHALMHDWWMYLVTSAFGTVLYDSVPRLCYRQHAANVVGSGAAGLSGLPLRARRHFLRPFGSRPLCDQLADFLAIHGGQLSIDQHRLIVRLLEARDSLTARARLAFTTTVHRQSVLDQLLLRVVLLLGRY
ncbi:MAG: glycosyltransferase [Gemmatimonadetes bacterium]|nr:glycosyltransferase [Gemmatimonadota bacterium]